MNPLYWVYDLETYPNIFTAYFLHPLTGSEIVFEISDRKNQMLEFVDFIRALKNTGCYMVGFNNLGFDYPIVHYILKNPAAISVGSIYHRAMQIINTPWERRFDHIIYDSEVIIPQIDLFKVHHFDNENRRVSLKVLEFNMRMENVQDLPFLPGTVLDNNQKDTLIKYNRHDVHATRDFLIESIGLLNFRHELSKKYDRNFLNANDTKIGKDYFIMELEKSIPGSCYSYDTGSKKPRQSLRPQIHLKDVVLPYIYFSNENFNRVLQYFKTQTISQTVGVFAELSATVDGFTFWFGAGGIHGSIDGGTVYSDDEYVIYDWDVASYYPNLAIANKLFPEHLSIDFCTIYKDVFDQRRLYKKGTAENAMLKLALNGVYGDSNNKYSPFYDPKYTMAITINGQLLLCLLAERLMKIPGLQMIQANTDGLTVRLPRAHVDTMKAVCTWWQKFTLLELESAIYKRMFIRDVNNYIAEYDNGKLKRKGAYEYDIEWHQNHSALIVPRAVESYLIHGADVRQFITAYIDPHDFMLLAKVSRSELLMWGNDSVQRVSRYYVSRNGESLAKISPPPNNIKPGTWKRANGLTDRFYSCVVHELVQTHGQPVPWDERINTKNKSVYAERKTGINAEWLTTICNDMSTFDWVNLNYEYYISQAEKLIKATK